MKSKDTPWTHTGVTKESMSVEFGPSGARLKNTVTVPKGTLCRKLDGGSNPWVVGDLGFIEDKRSLMYHDANYYGIRIPEESLEQITPVKKAGLSLGA